MRMEMILTILGALLGVLVPVLFAYTLLQGIRRSPLDAAKKAMYSRNAVVVVTLWTILVWVLSLSGWVNYHVGESVPRIALLLFIPVLIGLYLFTNSTVKTILDATPLATLVGVQVFRLAGFVFLIIPGLGMLPHAFVSGGYGDLVTGILAICAAMMLMKKAPSANMLFIAFSVIGLFDLLNIAGMMFYYYPLWHWSGISSAAMSTFSLVMVPALAAPMAMLLHFAAIRNFVMKK